MIAEELVPPRPNLGPEPWGDPPSWPGAVGWWVLALAITFLLAGWRWRRHRRTVRRPGREGSPERIPHINPSARDQLIASSEVVRSALIDAFGPGWGSKTTEEIAAEPALTERLDPEEVSGLVGFLIRADRAKFAGGEPETDEDWQGWAASFAGRLTTSVRPNDHRS